MHGREAKCIYDFGGNSEARRPFRMYKRRWENIKRIYKDNVKLWIGFIWLRIYGNG
jgi:hypothetical protein